MIIILTQSFPSRVGGIENLISNLSLYLSETEKVIVFADQHHIFYDTIYDQSIKEKFLVRRVGGIKYFRRRKKIKELKPFLLSNQVKCIIGDTWKSFELCIDLINLKNIPTICLTHGNEIINKDQKHFLRIKNTLNKVSSVVCNSEYTKTLISKYNLIKPTINTIHPGASNYADIKEKIIPNIEGDPIILTLARLEKRKGHKEIIYSVKELLSEFPSLQYIIAGSGSELKNLKKLTSELNLEKNILFVGNISDSQKKYLFQKVNLMVMPTLDETTNRSIEGFGIAYLEASFFSIPSIASNIGGTPEAVVNNNTGVIIDEISQLYPTIRDLLSNQVKLKSLGTAAQKRAITEFTWEVISKKYKSLIKDLY